MYRVPKGNVPPSSFELEDYLASLRALSFIQGLHVQPSQSHEDALLVIEVAGTKRERFQLHVLRTHLSGSLVELWVGRARQAPACRRLLLAPYVSRAMGERLREAGLFYADRSGNLFLAVGKHSALIEGKPAERTRAVDRAWRAPSYQVLFAYLARPELLNRPVREAAEQANVSTSPVLQVRHKLIEHGWVLQRRNEHRWTPGGLQQARDFWLRGYQSTLRPSLLVGRWRPRENAKNMELELFSQAFGQQFPFRWGGASAAYRLDGHYVSDRVVIHALQDVSAKAITSSLRMAPDAHGPIIVLRSPGPVALDSPDPTTVHPLLAWAELLEEGNDRASDAAQRLAHRFGEDGHAV